MVSVGWRFPPLSGGTRQGYTNNDIEAFKGEELMDNLAREICQNSLDAKPRGADITVKVVFELRKFPTSQYPVFSEYRKCLDGCRQYWQDKMDAKLRRFLSDADEMLSRESIPVLIAGDYNTTGLCGSRDGSISSAWEALTGSDGLSVKPDETSGGSYGIGKNAPFACSALSMVFYNTYAADEGRAFLGVARLATLLNESGKPTQRVGKYQKNDDEGETWTPIFQEDADSFRDAFSRSEKGSDVIIAGFNQEQDWINRVTEAILKNFFVAVSEGKLVVVLKEGNFRKTIDTTTIGQYIEDYSSNNSRTMADTAQLYKAFTQGKKYPLSILSDAGNPDAEVFILSDSTFNRTIANFRDTGMLINLKRRRIFQHYAAVFIVRGKELGELLRDTETTRHNKWDYTLIPPSEKTKRTKARNALRKIDDLLLELLKSEFEVPKENSVDAAGVGEYIPDSVDGMGGASEGDDILKAKIKIGKVRTSPTKTGTISVSGSKEVGQETGGDVRNHERNPHPNPPMPHPPRPVNPDIPTDNPRQGAQPGKGTKTVIIPNLSAQRGFPINSTVGLYKIIIVPTESYNNLYISCSARGEDGRSDTLNMESFTYNGASIPIKDGKAGPVRVQANVPAIFFVRFASKEKMVLNLHITEVPTKWNR